MAVQIGSKNTTLGPQGASNSTVTPQINNDTQLSSNKTVSVNKTSSGNQTAGVAKKSKNSTSEDDNLSPEAKYLKLIEQVNRENPIDTDPIKDTIDKYANIADQNQKKHEEKIIQNYLNKKANKGNVTEPEVKANSTDSITSEKPVQEEVDAPKAPGAQVVAIENAKVETNTKEASKEKVPLAAAIAASLDSKKQLAV